MSNSSSSLSNAITLGLACSLTAAISYYVAAKEAEKKILLEKKAAYDRELLLKEKTIAARELTGEPKGHLITDVTIDKVYLWECEDLKKRFSPCNIKNVMKNIPSPHQNPYFFPSLKKNSIATEKSVQEVTEYNKLITNHECVLGDVIRKPNQPTHSRAYMRAGPRKELHFDPKKTNAAIVTCGGLCPGLNNVVRAVVNTLHSAYGIDGKVWGIQGGFRGFWDFDNYAPVELTPDLVANIHHEGGTVLGSSRGGFDQEKILEFLKSKKITCLFVIGGDGTHRGAFSIHEGCIEKASVMVTECEVLSCLLSSWNKNSHRNSHSTFSYHIRE
jgi:hypothetical protein